jgi:hypothetical protein
MLRIDETSQTLVAPQADAFVADVAPDQAELTTLLASSWEAFAGELGQPHLRFCAHQPAPGVDMLAFDADTGRVVVVQISGAGDAERLLRALDAAAAVASWDAARLASVHEALSAAVPGDSPRIVLVAGGGYDEGPLATAEWLVRRHGVELSAYSVNTYRFGSERLLSVRREFPPREGAQGDPATAMQHMLASLPGHSAPPPGA